MDVLTKEQRSRNMSAIRSTNTRMELRIRQGLWSVGTRGYRLHAPLAGKPDLVFGRVKLVVFLDGCFWHGCPRCYRQPTSNTPFWVEKVEGNKRRDKKVRRSLRKEGWIVLQFWEHAVKRDPARVVRTIASKVASLRDGAFRERRARSADRIPGAKLGSAPAGSRSANTNGPGQCDVTWKHY